MIIFPHLRTSRVAVRLAELTLGQAISLCKLPPARHELNATEMLRFIAAGAEHPQPRYVTDPLLWTVQERTLMVCHYLAHVTSDGPDFSVGDGRFSDYVVFDRDLAKPQVELGGVAGKARVMRPLLGVHAQSLEVVCETRLDWIIGAMACQIGEKGAAEPEWGAMSDVAMLEWLKTQMARIRDLPESMFEEVFAAYWRGADELEHFFRLDFDDQGPVYRAITQGKEGAGDLAPARFLASSCIGIAKELVGGPDRPGR